MLEAVVKLVRFSSLRPWRHSKYGGAHQGVMQPNRRLRAGVDGHLRVKIGKGKLDRL